MNISEKIKLIKDAVAVGDYQKTEKLTSEALAEKESPEVIMREGVLGGIRSIHEKYYSESKVFPTSAIFLGYEAARISLDMVASQMEDTDKKATVVLGTLEGDTHDVGTKWLALTLLAGGYNIKYLGRDISPRLFVHKAIDTGADVIGVSCHQTTGYRKIEELLNLFERSKEDFGKEIFVMAGGSVITEKYANLKGLGYAGSAVQALDLLDKRFGTNDQHLYARISSVNSSSGSRVPA
jgi:methylmalonyl-CoA mutase cobalamin-binding domain/chain